MRKEIIKLKSIYVDEEIYPRDSHSEKVVKQYAKAMKFGSVFPPIRIAKFKGKNYLVDGLHRIKAQEELGEQFVNADVQDNLKNKLDIYLASIRANLQHGHTLTKGDRLKVAKQLKKMKVDTDDISKLLHINNKDLVKIGLGNIMDIKKLTVARETFTSVLSDKTKKRMETKGYDVKDRPIQREEKPIKILTLEDEQDGELNAFLWYLKNTQLLHNKLNKKKLVEIEKEIGKILVKMRK